MTTLIIKLVFLGVLSVFIIFVGHQWEEPKAQNRQSMFLYILGGWGLGVVATIIALYMCGNSIMLANSPN